MLWWLWEPWPALSETASCLPFAVMSRPSWSLSFLCLLRSGGLKQSQAQLYESYRQARKKSEGFWIETLFQMQKTNGLN